MKLFKLKIFLLLALLMPSIILSIPTYNQYDPLIINNIYGQNKTYKKQTNKFQANFRLSPFYQHAAHARNKEGSRVPEGNIFDRWNMFGLFFGVENNQIKAAPITKPFVLNGGDPNIPNAQTIANYPKLSAAWRILDNVQNDIAPYNINVNKNYTDESEYNLTNLNQYLPLIYTNYEKYGLRLEFNFNFKSGFGINIQNGLIDYKQTPQFEIDPNLEPTPTYGGNTTPGDYIYTYLTEENILKDILKEVGLNTNPYQVTTLEDTHIKFHFQLPFEIMNNSNESVVLLTPYLAIGGWIPTGKEKNEDQAFSLPTGNQGFWGLTLEGALNFELPGTIEFGFGAGTAYFFKRNLDNQRIASQEYQQGIFPWKTNITKEPGLLWHFDSRLKAKDFINNFSATLDFIYLRHNKDDITIRESDPTRNTYFIPSINEENSKWWATILEGGLEYKFSEGLQIGIGFQSHLSGRRVYRDTTVIGTMSFVY